jgi:hypothetical protein
MELQSLVFVSLSDFCFVCPAANPQYFVVIIGLEDFVDIVCLIFTHAGNINKIVRWSNYPETETSTNDAKCSYKLVTSLGNIAFHNMQSYVPLNWKTTE